MNLLALDTSTLHAAVVVCRGDGATFVAPADPATRHGRKLMPAIHDLLCEAALSVANLDGIAVGLGPGSFTGLRIGVMAAKTLAYAAGKPLVGLDSLEVLARNAPEDARDVAVIADAQRGDLFTAGFSREWPGGPLLRTQPSRLEPATSWRGRLAAGTVVLGPGVERLPLPLPDCVRPVEPERNLPRGSSLAALAREVWAGGRRDDFWTLEPVYLRRSAAEEKAKGA